MDNRDAGLTHYVGDACPGGHADDQCDCKMCEGWRWIVVRDAPDDAHEEPCPSCNAEGITPPADGLYRCEQPREPRGGDR